MKALWINKKDNKSLILFFNGLMMDENAIAHLDTSGFDIIMFYDYSDNIEQMPYISDYNEIFIVAWSGGVPVSLDFLAKNNIPYKKFIAINGTPFLIHDDYGIKPWVYKKTVEKMDTDNRQKFFLRMFGSANLYKKNTKLLPKRSLSNQIKELQNVRDKTLFFCDFDKITSVIGKLDYIVPYANQRNFWVGRSHIVDLDIPHFPFLYFKSWKQIIDL